MRGYYQFTSSDVGAVFQHLLSLEHVTIEDRESINQAIAIFELGFYFADALHHTSYIDCINMASFDDKKFARHAKRMGLMPSVLVPK
jgi:predicted nucleic-acid-binding protein